MTPKEKAQELVDKFRLNILDYEGSGLNTFKAKQCALIAVDEIQEAVRYLDDDSEDFWCEVKHELMLI